MLFSFPLCHPTYYIQIIKMRSTAAVLSAFLAVAHGQNILSAKGNLGQSKGLQGTSTISLLGSQAYP